MIESPTGSYYFTMIVAAFPFICSSPRTVQEHSSGIQDNAISQAIGVNVNDMVSRS
jgi:hypothetical protein